MVIMKKKKKMKILKTNMNGLRKQYKQKHNIILLEMI